MGFHPFVISVFMFAVFTGFFFVNFIICSMLQTPSLVCAFLLNIWWGDGGGAGEGGSGCRGGVRGNQVKCEVLLVNSISRESINRANTEI